MTNQSRFDPSRYSVGKIYRDAQITGEKQIVTGDMNYEMRKSLVDDLNDTIIAGTSEFEGRQFYIQVYEKWDLVMKKALVRKLYKSKYRPYPEADTLVFKIIPYSNQVYFCWQLPQRGHMVNELQCPELYPESQLMQYRHWENDRLEHFGFMKDEEGNWKENPLFSGDILVSKDPNEVKKSMYTSPVLKGMTSTVSVSSNS